MAIDFHSPLDLHKNQLLNAAFQNLASAPGSPSDFQYFGDTGDGKVKYYFDGTWYTFATEALINSLLQGLSWKSSVRVATTEDITLSGTQTIDDIALDVEDHVLVKDQTDASENGIYVVKSGSWVRRDDANLAAELLGAVVPIREGTSNEDTTYRLTNDTIVLDTTDLVFELFGSSVPDASTTTKGILELATQSEAEAKTDTVRAVTPASLADFTISKPFTIGDGSTTDIVITHNLGTRNIDVVLLTSASPYRRAFVDYEATTTNTATLKFTIAPSSNEFIAIVKA